MVTPGRLSSSSMDAIDLLTLPTRRCRALCPIPSDVESVTSVGEEVHPGVAGASLTGLSHIWNAIVALYRTGLHPAIQVCIRSHGQTVLNRAIGYSHGNAPGSPADAPRTPVSTATPFTLFSASKIVTAMLIHKLDEQRVIHIDDHVCDYIPEFARNGKEWVSLRHLLCHRAGIPNLPPEAIDLDLLPHPDRVVEILCDLPLRWRPGRMLAYHAVTGGFILGEVVRRATGQDIRTVLAKEILEPLGFRWMNYGAEPADIPLVAENAFTGLPVLPPFSAVMRNVLGTDFKNAVRLSNDPRFLSGPIPAANTVTNADELCAFFQCLLDGGSLNGVRVFDPRTIRHAATEQSYWELDLTLVVPLRYRVGMMLGGWIGNLIGPHNPRAIAHNGITKILPWADPERKLAVAFLNSGKPFINLDLLRLYNVLAQIARVFPKQ